MIFMSEKENNKEEKPKVEPNSKPPKNTKPIVDLDKVIKVNPRKGLCLEIGSNENDNIENYSPLNTDE